MTEWVIPLSDLWFDAEETAAAVAVLERRWLSSGPELAALEDEFAAACGVAHAIAVANGTAALHLALLAVGVSAGTEVVQPALNFVAAANMTQRLGAIPHFVDVASLDDPTLDPDGVVRAINDDTSAIVVMHYGGLAGRMEELLDVAARTGVPIVEDACHAVGGRYRRSTRPVGALGDVGCYSFFSNKNLACGEGGMVTTDREDIAEKVRSLRSHGMTSLSWDRFRGHASSYDVTEHGFNYRLDDLRAAIARVQLAKLAAGNDRRRALAAEYEVGLRRIGWQLVNAGAEESSWHLAVAVAPDRARRDQARDRLLSARIQTSLHYPCVADFEVFGSPLAGDLRTTRTFVDRAITLPMFPALTASEVRSVVATIESGGTGLV